MSAEPGRATSLAGLRERMERMLTPGGVLKGLQFKPRPTDVIIAPFGKCGTTWLQQIIHGLRTRGDLDYDDISRVVPWIETASALDLDLDAEQRGEPRAYKSHLTWDLVPKGGRYIVSFRDPRDACVSMFRFMEGWFIEPGSVSMAEFAREHYLKREEGRDYWTHLASWWEQRGNTDVLLLTYETMRRDPARTVRVVADFIGIELDEVLLELVLDRSSFEFMLEHKDKFDDLMMRELSERVGGLPPGGDSSKVRRGDVGSHRDELPGEVAHELQVAWKETVEARFGFADYAALVAAMPPIA